MPQDILPGAPRALGPVSAPATGDPRSSADIRAIVQNLLDMMAGSVQVAAPTGTVAPYAGDTAPAGWLPCDGRAVNRTDYPALFTVVGTRFGAGNGTTTFNLPDLRGRTPVGAGQGAGLTNRVSGTTGGKEKHALTIQEMPAHTHPAPTARTPTRGTYEVPAPNTIEGYAEFDYGEAAPTGSVGGNAAHENMPPFLALTYIVRT